MKYVFICKKCGYIEEEYDEEYGTKELKCKQCSAFMDWENSFPPLTANDMIQSARNLFELSKKQDEENLDHQFQIIIKNHSEIDKTTLNKYVNHYEKICSQYPDNDDRCWQEIYNRFEAELNKKLDSNLVIEILSSIPVFIKNYYRKPYVIVVASMVVKRLSSDEFIQVK